VTEEISDLDPRLGLFSWSWEILAEEISDLDPGLGPFPWSWETS